MLDAKCFTKKSWFNFIVFLKKRLKKQICFVFGCEAVKYLISFWKHTTVLNRSLETADRSSPRHVFGVCCGMWRWLCVQQRLQLIGLRSFSTLRVHPVSLSLHWNPPRVTEADYSLIIKSCLFNVTEKADGKKNCYWTTHNKMKQIYCLCCVFHHIFHLFCRI